MTVPSLDDRRISCSQISHLREEPQLGTASRVDRWLLLTYDRPMESRALPQSELPFTVKERLAEVLERVPRSRVLLLRSHELLEEGVSLRVVQGRESDPFYLTYSLDRYEDLLDIDLVGILTGETDPGVQPERDPFHLVCTNGRRDPCCAELGLPTFEAMQRVEGERVWQCSHVSGHRFAANVLAFPHGIYYGRVEPAGAAPLLAASAAGRLLLGKLRGRACYQPVVQAAEGLLRQETGVLELEAYRLLGAEEGPEKGWRVQFQGVEDSTVHRLEVEARESEDLDQVSCWSDKRSPVVQYILRQHQVQRSG